MSILGKGIRIFIVGIIMLSPSLVLSQGKVDGFYRGKKNGTAVLG